MTLVQVGSEFITILIHSQLKTLSSSHSLHPHFTKLCFLCVLYRLLPRVVPSHRRECVWLLELGHGGESSAGAWAYVWFPAILVFSVIKFLSILKLCRNVGEDGRKVHVFCRIFIWR